MTLKTDRQESESHSAFIIPDCHKFLNLILD